MNQRKRIRMRHRGHWRYSWPGWWLVDGEITRVVFRSRTADAINFPHRSPASRKFVDDLLSSAKRVLPYNVHATGVVSTQDMVMSWERMANFQPASPSDEG